MSPVERENPDFLGDLELQVLTVQREVEDHQDNLVYREVKEMLVDSVLGENLAGEENQEPLVVLVHQDSEETRETVELTAPLELQELEVLMVLPERKVIMDYLVEVVSQELGLNQVLLDVPEWEVLRETEVKMGKML